LINISEIGNLRVTDHVISPLAPPIDQYGVLPRARIAQPAERRTPNCN